jgi:hypothetical protein
VTLSAQASAARSAALNRVPLHPHGQQGDLLRAHFQLQQIARVHIDAEGAVIDLRHAQIDQLQQLGRQGGGNVVLDGQQVLVGLRCQFEDFQAFAHDDSLPRVVAMESLCGLMA